MPDLLTDLFDDARDAVDALENALTVPDGTTPQRQAALDRVQSARVHLDNARRWIEVGG